MNTSNQSQDEGHKRGGKSKAIAASIFLILLLSVSCKTEELPHKSVAEYLSGESRSLPVMNEVRPEVQGAEPNTVAASDKVLKIETDSTAGSKDTLIKEAVLMTFIQYSY